MLELFVNQEIFGSYKDLEIEMKINDLDSIKIDLTKYAFKKVEDERILTFKEIKNLALFDELEKIKYQNKVKEILKNGIKYGDNNIEREVSRVAIDVLENWKTE